MGKGFSHGSVASTTTLDPANKGANVTLSLGNLKGTATSTTNSVTRSIANYSTLKYYFEFTLGTASNSAVGICNSGTSLTDFLGGNVNSMGTYGGGWTNAGGGTTTGPSFVSGHTYGMALDIGNRAAWVIDITAAGQWNSNGTADPTTNTNGAAFIVGCATGAVYAAVTLGNSGDNITFNFGATPFAGSLPPGYGKM